MDPIKNFIAFQKFSVAIGKANVTTGILGIL